MQLSQSSIIATDLPPNITVSSIQRNSVYEFVIGMSYHSRWLSYQFCPSSIFCPEFSKAALALVVVPASSKSNNVEEEFTLLIQSI
jgi:hypothetical protein